MIKRATRQQFSAEEKTMPDVEHRSHKVLNNRAENSHRTGVVTRMPLGLLGHRFPEDLDGPDATHGEAGHHPISLL